MSNVINAIKLIKHKLDNYDGESLGSIAAIADEAIAEIDELMTAAAGFVEALNSTAGFSQKEFRAWIAFSKALDSAFPPECECEESPEFGKLTCEIHRADG